jgi:hypothetical protein
MDGVVGVSIRLACMDGPIGAFCGVLVWLCAGDGEREW